MLIKMYSLQYLTFQKHIAVRALAILIICYGTKSNQSDADEMIEKQSKPKPLRYGTYVTSINETCLQNDCTYDESSPDIWSRKKVFVTARKFLGNVHNYNSSDEGSDQNQIISDNKTRVELFLTPPIITKWVYELGFALSEGNYIRSINILIFCLV